MDNRSRGKRYLPKGLPLDGKVTKLNKSDIVRVSDLPNQESSAGNWSNKRLVKSSQKSRLICGAYAEPLGFDMIENILMQRDFIID